MLMSITGSYAQNSNNGSATSSNILENYKRLDISFASTIIDNFDDNFNGVSCGVIWGTRLSKSIPLFIEYGANVSWTTRKYENDLLDDDGYYYFLKIVWEIVNSKTAAFQPIRGIDYSFLQSVNLHPKCISLLLRN